MNFEEKVLSTENIFDGKVIKVDKETVELPNGKKAFTRNRETSWRGCADSDY